MFPPWQWSTPCDRHSCASNVVAKRADGVEPSGVFFWRDLLPALCDQTVAPACTRHTVQNLKFIKGSGVFL
jgi:hypothetical protein